MSIVDDIDLELMHDEELYELRSRVQRELDVRKSSPGADAARAEMIRSLRTMGHIKAPANPRNPRSINEFTIWKNPGRDYVLSYVRPDRVRHEGRVWECLIDANRWVPGEERSRHAWQDITSKVLPTT